MTRSLKALGLTLAAALAMGATAASVAQAESPAQLTAESSPVLVTGKQIGGMVYARQNRSFQCAKGESQEFAKNGDTTFSAGTPTIKECTWSGGAGPVTVQTNGCAFLFHLTANMVEGQHRWTATSDFVCPPGKKGEILVYTSETKHTEGVPICVWEYTTQEGLQTVELTNEPAAGSTPKDWLRAHVEIGGIVSKRIFGSALLCGSEIDSNGTLKGEVELKGENEAGEPVGITVSTSE